MLFVITECTGCFYKYDDAIGGNICPKCGRTEGDPPKEPFMLAPGTVIKENLHNRYIIGNAINSGGFGIIYVAKDIHTDKVIAIKEHFPTQNGIAHRIPGTQKVSPCNLKHKIEYDASLERFKKEAHIMAKFNSHNNIVNVFNCCEDNGTAYLHMEYLDGLNLSQLIQSYKAKNRKFSIEEVNEIAFAVIDALKDVHKAGILHRDIAPDNIFITTDGKIKLIDFGAARFDNEEEKDLILKIGYAPPEQYSKKEKQKPFTDIYALGATLYTVLTGEKPIDSQNRKEKDTLIEPSEIDKNIPSYISNIIMKAMAIDSTLRFQNIYDLEDVLRKEKDIGSIEREKRIRKIKRALLVSSAVFLVVLFALNFGLKVLEKQNEAVLQPATLTLWYPETVDSNLGNAFEAVAEEFSKQQHNVKIDVIGIPDDDYYDMLDSSNKNLPNLFILKNTQKTPHHGSYSISENVIPKNIFEKYNDTLTDECHFLEDYYDYFPDGNLIPLGFNVPVIYVNSSEISVPYNQDTVNGPIEFERLTSGNDVFVNPENEEQYKDLYANKNTNNIYDREGYIEDFYTGKAMIYFSSSSEYDKSEKLINNKIATRKILIPSGNNVSAYFSLLCGMNSFSEAENIAAKAFVKFLLTNNAQNILYIQECVEALPLNKKTAEAYAGENFNSCFGSVYDNIDSYAFN